MIKAGKTKLAAAMPKWGLLAWGVLALFAMGNIGAMLYYTGRDAGAIESKQAPSKESASIRIPDLPPPYILRELTSFRRVISQAREDIGAIKQALNDNTSRDRAISNRLTLLEETTDSITGALPPPPESEADKAAKIRARTTPPHVVVELNPLPFAGFDDAPRTLPLVTIASLGHEASSTKTLFAVDLAAGASIEGLRNSWKKIGTQHGAIVSRLTPQYRLSRLASGETQYRLIAGPFHNAADAARLCARFQSGNMFCRETVFGGETLGE